MPDFPSTTTDFNTRSADRKTSVNVQEVLKERNRVAKGGLEGVQVREKSEQLGKDDFLKLLITQLTHQDPTRPIQDQQFIAQMAQFSSLEQMQNMTSSLNRLANRQAHDLIGRYVTGPDFVGGAPVAGIVDALFYDGSGSAFVKVQGRSIALKSIQMIRNPILTGKNSNPSPMMRSGLGVGEMERQQAGAGKVGDVKEQVPNRGATHKTLTKP